MNKKPLNGLPVRGPLRLNGLARALAATAQAENKAAEAAEEQAAKDDADRAIGDLRAVSVLARKVRNVERMLAAYDAQIAGMPEGHPLREQAAALVRGVRDAMAAAERDA